MSDNKEAIEIFEQIKKSLDDLTDKSRELSLKLPKNDASNMAGSIWHGVLFSAHASIHNIIGNLHAQRGENEPVRPN